MLRSGQGARWRGAAGKWGKWSRRRVVGAQTTIFRPHHAHRPVTITIRNHRPTSRARGAGKVGEAGGKGRENMVKMCAATQVAKARRGKERWQLWAGGVRHVCCMRGSSSSRQASARGQRRGSERSPSPRVPVPKTHPSPNLPSPTPNPVPSKPSQVPSPLLSNCSGKSARNFSECYLFSLL